VPGTKQGGHRRISAILSKRSGGALQIRGHTLSEQKGTDPFLTKSTLLAITRLKNCRNYKEEQWAKKPQKGDGPLLTK